MGQLETKNRYLEAHMPVLPKALEYGGLQWASGSLGGPRGGQESEKRQVGLELGWEGRRGNRKTTR